MSVTREQAEAVLEAVKERYRSYWETGDKYAPQPPKLVENWDWLDSGPTAWAIVWEEGPFEWAYRATSGGFDEEAALLIADAIGPEATRERARAGDFTEQPVAVPAGVWLEPVTTWAVGIYES